MGRFGCLRVPSFPLAAILRTEPPRPQGLGIESGNGSSRTIVHVDSRARALGVRPGMRTSDARSRAPELVVRTPDPDLERLAQEALLEIARGFSPRIQDSGPGRVHLDLGRTGGRAEEARIGQAMIRAAATSAQLPVLVGFSDTRRVASLAADLACDVEIVAPGEEEDFLAGLDVDRLEIDGEIRRRLDQWGISSLGELSHLPRPDLGERLGSPGLKLQDLARGLETAPLVPSRVPEHPEESIELDGPLTSIEPILFLIRAAIDRLGRQLLATGRSCRRLELELELEDGERHRNAVTLRTPTRDAKVLWTLIRLELERRPPRTQSRTQSTASATQTSLGISGLRLRLCSSPSHEVQLPLFGTPTPKKDRLEALLARLLVLLGEEARRGVLQLKDSHRPEVFSVLPFEVSLPHGRGAPPPQDPLLGLRRLSLDAGYVAEVGSPEDPTATSTWDGLSPPRPMRRIPGSIRSDAEIPHPFQGDIARAAGPWSLVGEWWTPTPLDREVWDIELLAGTVLRLAIHRSTRKRRIDGIYD